MTKDPPKADQMTNKGIESNYIFEKLISQK